MGYGPIGVVNPKPQTSARVNFAIANNATWNDSLQFDPPCNGAGNQSPGWPWWLWGTGCTGGNGTGPTGWNFSGQNFRMDIKANYLGGPSGNTALLSITSTAGQVVVQDYVNRVLSFNVPEATIQASLIPGVYVYDFIMNDNSNPTVRVQLCHGTVTVTEGLTGG